MSLHIDGPQSGALSEAIESAFPSPMLLQQVMGFKLDDSIFNYAGFGALYPEIRFNVLQQYNARYEIDRLVVALLEQNPTNDRLLDFAWRHKIVKRPDDPAAAGPADDRSLERMLDPDRGFSNPTQFLQRFGQIMNCVCRMEVPTSDGSVFGTGFLVGNETLMTNYHVVKDLVEGTRGAKPENVELLFDFREGPDGGEVSAGVPFQLADNWLIDHSPYHEDDLKPYTVEQNLAKDRPADHLDYAVLRVRGKPGEQRIGVKPEAGGAKRGFLSMPDAAHDFDTDFEKDTAAVFIMQHPAKKPLAFDWEKPAVLGRNGNRTRVLYKVNTLGGSSGSPCFNAKLQWIALHHAGDPDWSIGHKPEYNEGIPVPAIRKLLEDRGKLRKIT